MIRLAITNAQNQVKNHAHTIHYTLYCVRHLPLSLSPPAVTAPSFLGQAKCDTDTLSSGELVGLFHTLAWGWAGIISILFLSVPLKFWSQFLLSPSLSHLPSHHPAASVTSLCLRRTSQTSSQLRKLCSVLSSLIPGAGAEKPFTSLQWRIWQSNAAWGTVGVMNGKCWLFLHHPVLFSV